jgi:plastocyanin
MHAHRSSRAAVAAIAAVTLAAAAGCGSNKSSSSASPAAGTITVSESEFAIDPASPTISKTGEVTFTVANRGKYPHALSVEGNGVSAKTPTIAPGKTATLKVDLKKNGTYDWYCPVDGHRQKGMDGKLTVGGSGGSGGSGGTKTTSPGSY